MKTQNIGLILLCIMFCVQTCKGQEIGSTFGYNGNIYTTIEVGYQVKHIQTTAYLAIPFWQSGNITHVDKLWHYRSLGYFTGLRVEYLLRRFAVGTSLQYEKYCYDLTLLVTHPPGEKAKMRDWRITPAACFDYKLHQNISVGINIGQHPDLHLRFNVELNNHGKNSNE